MKTRRPVRAVAKKPKATGATAEFEKAAKSAADDQRSVPRLHVAGITPRSSAPTLITQLPLPLRRFIVDLADKERILVGLDLRPGKR